MEVAHEALIREWPTLRVWLDEDRANLRLHRALSEASHEWERHARDPDLLYRGARLAQACEWADAYRIALSAAESDFLDFSVALARHQQREHELQRNRELQSAQQLVAAEQRRAEEASRAASRLRRRAVFLVIATLLAVAMAGAALFFGAEARQGTIFAQENARLAGARELVAASPASLDVDPERSILLARQAVLTTYQADGTSN